MSTISYTFTRGDASGTRPRVTSQTSTTSVFTRTSYASMWERKPLSSSSSMTTVSKADSDDASEPVKERSPHLQDVIAAYRHTQEIEAINARRLHKQSSQLERYEVLRAAGRELGKLQRSSGQPVVPLVLISCEEEDIKTWESSFTSDAAPREYIGQLVDYYGPPAIPSPHLLSPHKPARSTHVTEPQDEEEEEQDSLLDQLLGLRSANGNDNDTLVLKADNLHVSTADEALDLDDLLVQTESLPVVKLPKVARVKDAQPKRICQSAFINNEDTLDLEDLIATGFDAAPSLLAVAMPVEVAKQVHSRPGRISKRDASKKRATKEGPSKKRRAVKEVDSVKILDEISARLETIDDGFTDLRNDIDAFDAKIKAFQAELSLSLGDSA
ncbi:hypothetical protein K443DRAFT_488189 [Laccaria amethystina LaAM-08-1]|uniref:Uncharacterized protein n=1 Tax=Laccaria amethystina LaAM-08-1 TaxID=1095629 RepID=A0A0C9WUZ2_9AGAR|nr:hypothetical protein K443DRAFT_488189 [Laccaria amethystina LaAM-08-1]